MKAKTFFHLSLIAATLLSQTVHATTNTLNFKNQRGSILEIVLLKDNKIEGHFTTAVASKSCPQAIGTRQPITGYIVGNVVTFSVAYPMCNSALGITGHFANHRETLDTLSILNHQAEDILHEGPGSRMIGHDIYTKIKE